MTSRIRESLIGGSLIRDVTSDSTSSFSFIRTGSYRNPSKLHFYDLGNFRPAEKRNSIMKSTSIRRYFKIRDHLQRMGCLRTRTLSLKERHEALLSQKNQSKVSTFRERHSQALEQFKATMRDQDPLIIEHPAQAAQNLITGAGNPILSNSQSKFILKEMNKCNYRCQK